MQTIYIDIYFLINFTVDLLALYFASLLSKIPVKTSKLIFSSFIGAFYAIVGVLLINNSVWMYPLSAFFLILMVLICTSKISFRRKIRYAIAFFLLQIMIGGLVYYGYCILDDFFAEYNSSSSDVGNRKLLILSLLVLLSIGIIKLFISFFTSAKAEKNVRLLVKFEHRKEIFEAFVDSGNLAVDLFDKTPVMFVTKELGLKIFGIDITLTENLSLSYSIKKRIRPIPIFRNEKSEIVYALKPDEVFILHKNKQERVSLLVAIDKYSTNFAGYDALVPLSALGEIIYEKKK